MIGRLLAILLSAGGWVLAGIRLVLDLIGYSTTPEDAIVATGLMKSFLLWLLNIPWWMPWAFAFSATVLLSYVFWPREYASLESVQNTPDYEMDQTEQLILLGNECLELSKDILTSDKRRRLYSHYRALLLAKFLELGSYGINVPKYDPDISDGKNVNNAAEFLATVGQLIKSDRLEDAKWYANDRRLMARGI